MISRKISGLDINKKLNRILGNANQGKQTPWTMVQTCRFHDPEHFHAADNKGIGVIRIPVVEKADAERAVEFGTREHGEQCPFQALVECTIIQVFTKSFPILQQRV